MPDLETQIRTLIDHQADAVDPVTASEVRERTAAPPVPLRRAPRRRSLAFAVGLVAAGVLLVAAIVVSRPADDDAGIDTVGSTASPSTMDTSSWELLEVPRLGWTVRVPPEWTSQTWVDHCDRTSGALLTNRSAPIERATEPPGCNTSWDPRATSDQSMVGLLISDDPATPADDVDHPEPADPEAPLSLGSFRTHDRVEGEVEIRSAGGPRTGDGYQHLLAWIGDDATDEDLARLEAVVASIRWDDGGGDPLGSVAFPARGGPLSTTLLSCLIDRGYDPTLQVGEGGTIDGGPGVALTWNEVDRAKPELVDDQSACIDLAEDLVFPLQDAQRLWPAGLAGPSQSAADAERDHVVPELAALPLDERARTWTSDDDPIPLLWFVDGDEIWVVVEPPRPPDGTDCAIGDAEGDYGDDWVCAHSYSELLRLSADGSVLAAYPMPDLIPSWLHVTAEAVYVGRIGDGGEPSSTVARVDRATGESEVVVFPHQEGFLAVDWPGWREAPDGVDLSTIIQSGAEGPGTIVQSYTGPLRVQPEGLEQLFGR